MSDSLSIQEYLESYIPQLVGKFLEAKPIPDMQGTEFTLQIIVEGEKSLVQGITIKDAKEVTVTAGGVANPMLSVTISEDIFQHIYALVTAFTGRRQYDTVKRAQGTVQLELGMPGGWTLPVKAVFNSAAQPSIKIGADAAEFAGIALGNVNAPQAFMSGKIKLEGDMAFGLSLAQLFV
jgi:hypothetical protein